MINRKLKPGEKVRVLANNSGSGQAIGALLTVRSCTGATPIAQVNFTEGGGYAHLCELELATVSKEDLQKEIKDLEELISTVKDKLAYLQETKAEKFDIDEFKAYQILKTISKPKMSKYEQAQAIAKLVRA